MSDTPESREKPMVVGEITLWRDRYCVTIGKRTVYLPAGQFQILCRLAAHPSRTFSAEDLYNADHSREPSDPKKAVTCTVFKLRRKLGTGAHQLQTVRGVGYRLVE